MITKFGNVLTITEAHGEYERDTLQDISDISSRDVEKVTLLSQQKRCEPLPDEYERSTYEGLYEDEDKPDDLPYTVTPAHDNESYNDISTARNSVTPNNDEDQDSGSVYDIQEVFDYMTKKNIQKPPRNFVIEIPRSKWKSCLSDDNPKKLKKYWANLFRDEIEKFNALCPFSFRGHEFLAGRKGNFFRAWGHCKHGQTQATKTKHPCWKVEVFGIKPEYTSTMKFQVSCKGTFRHKSGINVRNFVTGGKRDALKEQLQFVKAGKLCSKLNRKANLDTIRCGNANSLYETKLLAQMRHEDFVKNDLDKDPFVDLYKHMKTNPQINSYVRVACAKPLVIVMVSDGQLEIIKRIRKIVHSLIAHMDATSNVVKQLPLDSTTIFLYAIVVSSPIAGEPPIAVGEFLLSDQTRGSISFALNLYLRICKTYCNLPSETPVFRRFESDDSKAMYGAIIEQTTHCRNVGNYLDCCWKELLSDQPKMKSNIHLCRAHSMHMVTEQSLKSCYGLTEASVQTLKCLMQFYFESRTIHEVVFYTKRIFRLCLSKFINDEVESILVDVSRPMPSSFAARYDWQTYIDESRKGTDPIWNSTAFGRLFDEIKREITDAINCSPKCTTRNPIYAPIFINYLQREVLAYTPLFTRIMMTARGDKNSRDTYDPVERWNREVKIVEERSTNETSLAEKTTGAVTDKGKMKIHTPKNGTKMDQGLTSNVGICKPRRTLPTFLKNVQERYSYQQKEKWGRKGVQVAARNEGIYHFKNLPIVRWGSGAAAGDKCQINFTNTCTFDNFFMILIYSYHKILPWRMYVDNPRNQLMESFQTLVDLLVGSSCKFNSARLHFLRSIQNTRIIGNRIDLRGDEHSRFLERLQGLSTDYRVERRCEMHGSDGEQPIKVFGLCNGDVETSVKNINRGGLRQQCPHCSNFMRNHVRKPLKDNLIPVVSFGVVMPMPLSRIPIFINILGDDYELFACSVYSKPEVRVVVKAKQDDEEDLGHYRTGFLFQNHWYSFDAVSGLVTAEYPKHGIVSTCWYKIII